MKECPDLAALRGYLTGGYAFCGEDADEIVSAMEAVKRPDVGHWSTTALALKAAQKELEALNLQNGELTAEVERIRTAFTWASTTRERRIEKLLVEADSHLSWMLHRTVLTDEFQKDAQGTVDRIRAFFREARDAEKRSCGALVQGYNAQAAVTAAIPVTPERKSQERTKS